MSVIKFLYFLSSDITAKFPKAKSTKVHQPVSPAFFFYKHCRRNLASISYLRVFGIESSLLIIKKSYLAIFEQPCWLRYVRFPCEEALSYLICQSIQEFSRNHPEQIHDSKKEWSAQRSSIVLLEDETITGFHCENWHVKLNKAFAAAIVSKFAPFLVSR